MTRASLPSLLAEMVDALGEDVARAVVDEWGGTRLWVPRRIRPGHPIATALGVDAAERLVRWSGGAAIAVPTDAAWRRAERDARIRSGRTHGVPAAVLARREGLTTGRIYQILRRRVA